MIAVINGVRGNKQKGINKMNKLVDSQKLALIIAIREFERFLHYANIDSGCAVPGEADHALDNLNEVYNLMYPEEIEEEL